MPLDLHQNEASSSTAKLRPWPIQSGTWLRVVTLRAWRQRLKRRTDLHSRILVPGGQTWMAASAQSSMIGFILERTLAGPYSGKKGTARTARLPALATRAWRQAALPVSLPGEASSECWLLHPPSPPARSASECVPQKSENLYEPMIDGICDS